jgi:hypothetical protein
MTYILYHFSCIYVHYKLKYVNLCYNLIKLIVDYMPRDNSIALNTGHIKINIIVIIILEYFE